VVIRCFSLPFPLNILAARVKDKQDAVHLAPTQSTRAGKRNENGELMVFLLEKKGG
jgi:hypothetical protein